MTSGETCANRNNSSIADCQARSPDEMGDLFLKKLKMRLISNTCYQRSQSIPSESFSLSRTCVQGCGQWRADKMWIAWQICSFSKMLQFGLKTVCDTQCLFRSTQLLETGLVQNHRLSLAKTVSHTSWYNWFLPRWFYSCIRQTTWDSSKLTISATNNFGEKSNFLVSQSLTVPIANSLHSHIRLFKYQLLPPDSIVIFWKDQFLPGTLIPLFTVSIQALRNL